MNNASSDDTVNIARLAWKPNGTHANFLIVDELNPGLASARKKGIEVSTYEILIFCDDDNHLKSSYVQEAYQIMNKDTEVGIAGGWIKPKLTFYPGKWIESNYTALAIGKQADYSKYVDWVFGAGMVFRKKVFKDLESRCIKLLLSDRKGMSQSSGGDAEMCQLARFIGYKIFYSPKLVLYHQIDEKRLTKRSFIRSNLQNLNGTVHLFILENLIRKSDNSLTWIIFSLLQKRCVRIAKAFSGCIIGKTTFLNFLEVYIGVIFFSWVLFHTSHINQSYIQIKENLYNGGK